MNNKNKNYPAMILIITSMLFSCSSHKRELCGSWGSILIENKSSFFAKTLPTSVKGEVILTFDENERFTWINKNEKLYLSGKYRLKGNKIYFDIEKEVNPLEVEFKFLNDKLIILTDDGFSFTFVKTENQTSSLLFKSYITNRIISAYSAVNFNKYIKL